MRPVRRLEVLPALPDELAALPELATNLHWTWDQEATRLFGRLWPGWRAGRAHPAEMVRTTSPGRLAELAADRSVVDDLDAVSRRLHTALSSTSWFDSRRASPLQTVAYFSPEFGISEALPQYSGGLGVLAGDHLKASSDLGIPLVGVGLLYTEGYFRQRLDGDGWQHESVVEFDPRSLGLTDTGVEVEVDLAGDLVRAHVWRADVGRIPLYLLDTEVPGNSAQGIAVTDRLYGGDQHHRLRQEIVLGIGGVRALRALGVTPDVFHSNEGHAGFLGLERIRELVAAGTPFAAAVEVVRGGGVFTTHTPVPAGIDRFGRELMVRYFTGFAADLGVSFDELFDLGRPPADVDDEFNMAVMGLRLAGRSNGVAKLHGAVSRRMFGGLWADLAIDEVPIGAVTNGVHGRTWASARVDALLTRVVGEDWPSADAERWARACEIDPLEVWATLNDGRAELVRLARRRLGGDVLHPRRLTIGFARRFATYKRATLLLSDEDRLRALLHHAERPVQFVFAGKAHPADTPGKELIQRIERFARQADVRDRFVFLADYDISIARTMYHGCDVWLNTPRRPLEACGTSGMKAALNGALNCSILDGWWDECYDGENGWAIESAEDDPDLDRRDLREATSLFSILEQQVVPTFYDRDLDGVARGWVDLVRHAWASLGPRVTAARMVRDYTTQLYEPAAVTVGELLADEAAGAVAVAAWRRRVIDAWPGVKVSSVDVDVSDAPAGTARPVTVGVELGGLEPGDVRVEVVHGPLGHDGEFRADLVETELRSVDASTFAGEIVIGLPGAYGVTARVIPLHAGLASPFDLGLAAWA
ncbi:MAG: alpha-glucan family phosphorylase [Ilumatobacteraceae bacterium]